MEQVGEGDGGAGGGRTGWGEPASPGGIDSAAEDIFGCAVGEAGFSLQAVARAGGQVLQLERAGDRVAIRRTWVTRVAVGGGVIIGMHLVSRGSEMQRTPGLVEAEVADHVRNMIAGDRVAGEAGGAVGAG